jgi:hypothetical protein
MLPPIEKRVQGSKDSRGRVNFFRKRWVMLKSGIGYRAMAVLKAMISTLESWTP